MESAAKYASHGFCLYEQATLQTTIESKDFEDTDLQHCTAEILRVIQSFQTIRS